MIIAWVFGDFKKLSGNFEKKLTKDMFRVVVAIDKIMKEQHNIGCI